MAIHLFTECHLLQIMIPLDDPSIVLRGEKDEEFEAFHLFQSALDVSSEGLIAFVTKKGEVPMPFISFQFTKTRLLEHSKIMIW